LFSADENEKNLVLIKQRQQSAVSHPPARSSLRANGASHSKVPEASQSPEIILGLSTSVGGQESPYGG